MLFNSFVFLFVFLPGAVTAFYVCKQSSFKLALGLLVVFSLFYYAYWNPAYLILILSSIGVNYLLAHWIKQSPAQSGKARLSLFSAVGFNLLLLGYFKYSGFFLENVNSWSDLGVNVPEIVLPLGISFFTFQQIAYQVDMYKRKIDRHNILEYTLFVSFFPQLIAGPIVHHREMMPQFFKGADKPFYWGNISVGLTIFIIGLFKKVIIADSLSVYVSPIYAGAADGATIDFYAAWVAALGYSFQLYFDFSGYSDMAIGCARMFGIRLPCNFFSPYKATSFIAFWRRWHMTLSRFLRDYIYIPLGGNRHGMVIKVKSLFLTMFLGGLWHGAGWTFIAWGSLHGALLIINNLWTRFIVKDVKPGKVYILAGWFVTFLAVTIAWVLFRAEDMQSAKHILYAMTGLNGISVPVQILNYGLIPDPISSTVNLQASVVNIRAAIYILAALCIAFFMPNTHQIMRRFRPSILPKYLRGLHTGNFLVWRPHIVWSLCMLGMLIWALSKTFSGSSEFLYYDF